MSKSRSFHYDLLRSSAMIYIVMFWHLDNYMPWHLFSGMASEILSFIFLSMFMFISGYMLSCRYYIENINDVFIFLIRRFIRIYPLYILSLTMFFFIGLINFKCYILSLVLISALTNDAPITLWFVICIFIYYLLFPILVYKFTKIKFILKTTIIFFLMSAVIIFDNSLIDRRLVIYFFPFIIGALSGRVKVIYNEFSNSKFIFISAIASLFIVLAGYKLRIESISRLGSSGFIPLLFYIVSKFRTSYAFIEIISYSSYCMYLFHRIIFYFFSILLPSDNKTLYYILMFIFGGFSVLIISYGIQYLYNNLLRCLPYKRLNT